MDTSEEEHDRSRKRAEEKATAARKAAEQQSSNGADKEDRSAQRQAFKEAGYRQSDPHLFNVSEDEMRKREQQLAVRGLHFFPRV